MKNVRQNSAIKNLAQKYKIDLIILFGSASTNRTHRESDVDLAVHSAGKLTLKRELDLYQELFKMFKKKIDLVDIKKASPLLLGQIAKDGRVLYDKKKQISKIKVDALKRFFDFEPYFRLREKTIKNYLSQNA